MRQAAAGARPVAPDAGLRRRDPFGLRLVALTGAAMAVLFGGAAQMGSGLAALASNWRPVPGAAMPAGGIAMMRLLSRVSLRRE